MKKARSNLFLLDVNFLVALAWPTHQGHIVAVERLESDPNEWATCALTELGFVRVSSVPAVVGLRQSASEACEVLQQLRKDERHIFIGELPSPNDLGGWDQVYGHKKVTDHYLLRLAESKAATLLTFDNRLGSLAKSPDAVEVLSLRPDSR